MEALSFSWTGALIIFVAITLLVLYFWGLLRLADWLDDKYNISMAGTFFIGFGLLIAVITGFVV